MPSTTTHSLLVGVGSNIHPGPNISKALQLLRDNFDRVDVSTLYRTRPLQGRDQPAYINGVAALQTTHSLQRVRQILDEIEDACERERDPEDPYAARTLDLDLLTYDDMCSDKQDLPAADLTDRDFCLIPAAELWPAWVHPVLGETLYHLAHAYFPDPPNIVQSISLDNLREK